MKQNQGGDARWMAAQALGWMRGKANRPDVTQGAARTPQQDKDAKLRQEATKALNAIK